MDRGISYPDKKHEDEYVNVNYSRVKIFADGGQQRIPRKLALREKYPLYGMYLCMSEGGADPLQGGDGKRKV